MTLSSINNRLWLSYLVIVVFVLLIAFTGIAVAFRDSPMLYRQVFYRISLVNGFLSERLPLIIDSEWESFVNLFLDEVRIYDIHVAILDKNGKVAYSTGSEAILEFPVLRNPDGIVDENTHRIFIFKDDSGQTWFYQASRIDGKNILITSSLRPTVSIRSLFQDELMAPLLKAGVIALILAFILSGFITRWITRPLQKIAYSAGQIAEGNYVKVPIEGPFEVKQLAKVINEMVTKVQDSIQSQQDFIANVSHEFKTPLTSIRGFAQAIYDGAITRKSEKKHAAEIILGETERLNFLVNDLLTLTKFDAGMIRMEYKEIDLNHLIREIFERLQFLIQSAGITFVEQFTEPMVLNVDAERISQVLQNLIENAIKFSAKGKQVIVSTALDQNWAIISVQDSGPGIAVKDQKRIFERFFQVDKSRRGGQGRGVGLGLPIAKQIVEAHGGSISVNSSIGQGSIFMVKLPLDNGSKKPSKN